MAPVPLFQKPQDWTDDDLLEYFAPQGLSDVKRVDEGCLPNKLSAQLEGPPTPLSSSPSLPLPLPPSPVIAFGVQT